MYDSVITTMIILPIIFTSGYSESSILLSLSRLTMRSYARTLYSFHMMYAMLAAMRTAITSVTVAMTRSSMPETLNAIGTPNIIVRIRTNRPAPFASFLSSSFWSFTARWVSILVTIMSNAMAMTSQIPSVTRALRIASS